jgi:hypothetical protein
LSNVTDLAGQFANSVLMRAGRIFDLSSRAHFAASAVCCQGLTRGTVGADAIIHPLTFEAHFADLNTFSGSSCTCRLLHFAKGAVDTAFTSRVWHHAFGAAGADTTEATLTYCAADACMFAYAFVVASSRDFDLARGAKLT